MNLIFCNEKCRHQQEGCCQLDGGSQITNGSSACCYYAGIAGSNDDKTVSAVGGDAPV